MKKPKRGEYQTVSLAVADDDEEESHGGSAVMVPVSKDADGDESGEKRAVQSAASTGTDVITDDDLSSCGARWLRELRTIVQFGWANSVNQVGFVCHVAAVTSHDDQQSPPSPLSLTRAELRSLAQPPMRHVLRKVCRQGPAEEYHHPPTYLFRSRCRNNNNYVYYYYNNNRSFSLRPALP